MDSRVNRFFQRRISWVLAALWAGGLGGAWSRADDRVAVRAKSQADYVKWKFGANPPRDETYLFAQGQYAPGIIRDTSLEKMPFLQIANTLATGLVKQHYYPTRDLEKADLLIVVHWGATSIVDSSYKLLAMSSMKVDDADKIRRDFAVSLANGTADPLDKDGGTPALSMAQVGETAYLGDLQAREATNVFQEVDGLARSLDMGSNAQLLGFGEALHRDLQSAFGTAEGDTIRSMLADSRYYLIVMAYDYQALRRYGQRKLLWSARLSMRSPGMNFTEGIVDMSAVGAEFFGHPSDGVMVKQPTVREGRVEIGPVRVLGAAEPPGGPGGAAAR